MTIQEVYGIIKQNLLNKIMKKLNLIYIYYYKLNENDQND